MQDSLHIDFDLSRLGSYLAGIWPEAGRLIGVQRYKGGQSNPTYRLDFEHRRAVLRRKPFGTLLKSAHAIEREYRVQDALKGTGVPVARMIHLCEDPAVIGAAFYVMEHVDGRIFWDPALAEIDRSDRRAYYEAMARALASLHRVDAQTIGLGDFGRPGSYFERQVARWTTQYRASETEKRPDMDRVIAWLAETPSPADDRATLVHGDFRIDNMIFDPARPEILCFLDWELSTIGHPFADISYQCMQWRLPNQGVISGLGGIDRTASGIPTEDEYLAIYCEAAGIQEIPHWSYYLVFNFFRLAAILDGVNRRVLDGNAADPERGRKMAASIPMLAQMAVEIIDRG
ncbi:phosphotransferase family protein [Rhizobium alvei]|uniref:Phosphotransferase family protein n=1 Tax=Rhizobium alvei TaxID=1132659 RepID=A0ABT8YI67_9HYPH|nr:phosphotransferase family protein [Rhizobium alvei]MDO6963391.1 phosphotransferase family protein [Rhizobium alvei]